MMKFNGNWDISGGASDFWRYIREPRPHRWTSWGVALALAGVVFWGFATYLIPYSKPKREIIYFENWTEARTAEEARADWIDRARETTRENAKRRAEYQRLAEMLGIEYDAREAEERTRAILGDEADRVRARPVQQRSTLAERAARGPQAPAPSPAPEASTAPPPPPAPPGR